MIRYALLMVMLTGCANSALAQEFPIWERLLRHYSGKTDETSVPSMKMGSHMHMSLKGDPAPGDSARATEILAAADSRCFATAAECDCSVEHRNLASTRGLLRRPEKFAGERAVRIERAPWAARQYSQ
jgi:hypothetical protein